MLGQPRTINVFYAWQSDLPEQHNHYAIRQALNRATAKLAEEASSAGQIVNFVIDDATRQMVGSGNIPASIIRKIQEADFFVGDVSSIHANQDFTRKTPNPNVVFELGFAAATLGWERILMLINTSLGGTPEDMPFDFDRHRATTYSLSDGAGSQEALNSSVLTGLRKLVEADAPRPTANVFNEAEAQRERDLVNLRWLLRAVYLPTLDEHISASAKSLSAATAYFSEILTDIVSSSQFHLYDNELRSAVQTFAMKWAESTSPDDYFSNNPNPRYFLYIATYGELRLAELGQTREDLRIARDHLLEIIRTRFPEINLQDTSRDAFNRYEKHLAEIEQLG